MAWQLTEDVATYLADAGGFLRARPAENTVMLTAAEAIRARGPGAFGGSAPLFGWQAEPDGTVTAAFLHTPPFPVVLTVMSDRHAAALATALAVAGRQVPGVNAAPAPGAAFAAAWQEHTGQAARTGMRMRLYALGRLLPPDPPPPGRARTAAAGDTGLLLAWLNAFRAEAGPPGPDESQRLVRDRLTFGGLVLWEYQGRPVSMAGRNRAAAGQARIGPVYTPPEFRGRGFGGAATAAVTQAALDDDADGAVLFTDLANPASNSLYQRLGYRPAGDWTVLWLGSPPGDGHR
jgi:GNAT superfamily N-acetyltransferase